MNPLWQALIVVGIYMTGFTITARLAIHIDRKYNLTGGDPELRAMGVTAWPFALIAALLVIPFVALYRLATRGQKPLAHDSKTPTPTTRADAGQAVSDTTRK
ncbi:hypothetical protein ACOZ38_25375 [Sphaerisporangium viridialbum]|uniref:hypothetical protein n=1 Tax=Sphaerisporangium viridialbum TaxID=46189 RepID=UPI003C775F8F